MQLIHFRYGADIARNNFWNFDMIFSLQLKDVT